MMMGEFAPALGFLVGAVLGLVCGLVLGLGLRIIDAGREIKRDADALRDRIGEPRNWRRRGWRVRERKGGA